MRGASERTKIQSRVSKWFGSCLQTKCHLDSYFPVAVPPNLCCPFRDAYGIFALQAEPDGTREVSKGM